MSYGIEPSADPIRPGNTRPVTITVDGSPVTGVLGQTLAGVMLSAGIEAWRRTSALDRPRGVFCGIGVCFDCVAVVNGLSDVRVCQRRAEEGDVVMFHRVLPSSAHDANGSAR
jgi:D-hydroxyproline dehydrogenase subunit gamma